MLSIFQVAYHKGVTVIGRHIVIGGKFHIQFKVGTESPGHIFLRDVIADQLSVDTGKRTPAVGTENTDIEDFRLLVHLVLFELCRFGLKLLLHFLPGKSNKHSVKQFRIVKSLRIPHKKRIYRLFDLVFIEFFQCFFR